MEKLVDLGQCSVNTICLFQLIEADLNALHYLIDSVYALVAGLGAGMVEATTVVTPTETIK